MKNQFANKTSLKKFFLLFAASIVLSLSACQVEQPVDTILEKFHNGGSEYVMVAAHRAVHNVYPENSLPAIRHSIEVGVDIVELDVKVSKDGIPFLMHDGTMDRTTNGSGDPEEFTMYELKQYRLTDKEGSLTEETIPTLEEALNTVKGKVMVDIDIKTSHLGPIIDVLRKTQTLHQAFFFDNDYDALKEIRSEEPSARFMPRAYSYAMADSAIRVFQPAAIHIDPSFNTKDVCDLIQSNNARIWINALGAPDRMIRVGKIEEAIPELIKNGANIIQTDEPEALLQYLQTKGLR